MILSNMEPCSSSNASLAAKESCKICGVNKFKYICPRCGILYCSVICYRSDKHAECSESFYKRCVQDALKGDEFKDPLSAKKMREMLQRVEDTGLEEGCSEGDSNVEVEDELDSDDEASLHERLEGINIEDHEAIWNTLTKEEKHEFERFCENPYKENVIPEWEPWWKIREKIPLVQEVGKDESNKKLKKSKIHENQPDIIDEIVMLDTLTKTKPNERVRFGVANVIAAYCWVSRLYKGDAFQDDELMEESVAVLFNLSSYVSKGSVFSSVDEAIADVKLNSHHLPEALNDEGTILPHLVTDVDLVLRVTNTVTASSNSYMLSALSQLYTALKILFKKRKSNKPQKPLRGEFSSKFCSTSLVPNLDTKQLRNCKHKIRYVLSYVNEYL